MEKLRKRWNLNSNLDVIAVLFVFAVNGSFAAYIGRPLFKFFNFSPETVSSWLYYPVRILVVFVIYQSTFPIVGWLFGQFKFAWNFEKKILSRLGLSFLFENKAASKKDN